MIDKKNSPFRFKKSKFFAWFAGLANWQSFASHHQSIKNTDDKQSFIDNYHNKIAISNTSNKKNKNCIVQVPIAG